MPCCCRNPDHVAVASRADSSVGADSGGRAPKANRMGDRDFEDDKAAIQKWRDQHTTTTNHPQQGEPSISTTTISNNIKGGPVVDARPQRSIRPDSNGGGSDESDSSNTYHLESNENNRSVKVSTEAVQAWQRSSSNPQQPPQPKRDLDRLRSPFEVSSSGDDMKNNSHQNKGINPIQQQQQQQQQQQLNQPSINKVTTESRAKKSSPRSQNIFRTALLDEDDEAAATTTAIVTPDASPATNTKPSSSANRSTTPSRRRLQQENHQPDEFIPPPSSPTKSYHHHSSTKRRRSPPRQHDHEVLRDQLIRDVVLKQHQQQHQALSSSSSSSSSSESNQLNEGDQIRGQVFLKVHQPPDDDNHNRMISPRSSLDEDDNYFVDDAVSDIFSDPALEEVANSLANDSESRERYILACRLLRTRITQPNAPPIMPLERQLLEDLRDRFHSSRTGGSAIAFEALSKLLEEEVETEQGNNHNLGNGIPLTDSSRSDSSGRQEQEQDNVQSSLHSAQYDDMDISQDYTEGEITVGEEETGFNTVFRNHPHPHVSWNDEKSPKAIPQLAEEQQTHQPSSLHDFGIDKPITTKPKMIRLDGWNSSTRIEQYPFEIMGLDEDTPRGTRVLTPGLMEALRGFFPYAVSEDNFLLKFSLVRDGSSLRALLRNVMASQHTIVCIETNDGEVFGSFSSTPWRSNANQQKWFGTGEAFLWKAKQSRYVPADAVDHHRHHHHHSTTTKRSLTNEMEVYPYTGHDDMVQYCSSTTLAVGGGSWKDTPCPYPGEPHGIGLLIDGDLEGGETNSCATFANPRLYGSRSTTSSRNEFTIENCEVWTLTPMNTLHAAEQLERQKYFLLEQHAESTSSLIRSPNVSPRRGRAPLSPGGFLPP